MTNDYSFKPLKYTKDFKLRQKSQEDEIVTTSELEIKGTKKYIKYLSSHLKKEHPSTKKRMKVEL